MALSLDYRTRDIPADVIAGYALARRITPDEADLRLRAGLQMQERILQLLERHGALPRWTVGAPGGEVRLAADRVLREVDRLCGEGAGLVAPGAEDELRTHASFLALMFFDDDADPTDPGELSHIPRSWWATPLGRLCDRVLRVVD